jgi:hypothetical protein
VTDTTTDEELFTDEHRRAILEGRLRGLHTDLYGLEMNLTEEEADPHGRAPQVAQFRKDIQSVKERIKAVRGILRSLPAKPTPPSDDDAPTG